MYSTRSHICILHFGNHCAMTNGVAEATGIKRNVRARLAVCVRRENNKNDQSVLRVYDRNRYIREKRTEKTNGYCTEALWPFARWTLQCTIRHIIYIHTQSVYYRVVVCIVLLDTRRSKGDGSGGDSGFTRRGHPRDLCSLYRPISKGSIYTLGSHRRRHCRQNRFESQIPGAGSPPTLLPAPFLSHCHRP